MKERQYGRSPYLSAFKTKDGSFFPKINKGNLSNGNKFLAKSLQKRNYGQSIFKVKQQKAVGIKIIELSDEKICQSKEYIELSKQLAEMERKFQVELVQLQKKNQQLMVKLKMQQKNSYQFKYGLWELKNQVIELEGLLKEEENQYERILYEMGYRQDQTDMGEQMDEGMYQNQNGNEIYEGNGYE